MKKENLNLADLDLKKLNLSEEESMALSYLTPALTRRMQKQLLAQLAPSEVRKLHRTLSSRNSSDNNPYEPSRKASSLLNRRSVDRLSSTLPRKYSNDNSLPKTEMKNENKESEMDKTKSFLPVKSHFKSETKSQLRDNQNNDEVRLCGPRAMRSTPSREIKPYLRTRTDTNVLYSPDSSLSESLSSCARDADSELSSRGFSTDSYSSLCRPSSKTDDITFRYPRPNKIYENSPSSLVNSSKTDTKKPSSTKRISRFLRPDFFDPPKDDNIVVKEKKEREIETQKVLKEIRDKRKDRLSFRRRSPPKEKNIDSDYSNYDNSQSTTSSFKETESSSAHIPDAGKIKNQVKFLDVKTPEKNTNLPEYVNVPSDTTKKTRISKLARPKSYPAESSIKPVSRIPEKAKISPEKESKLTRFRKGFVKKEPKEKSKEDKNELNKNINEEEKVHKNKLLHSIEKKLEKFRSSPDKLKENSAVENTIRKLREQSLPKNLEHCTESGLIKRAVSVEDVNAQLRDKPLQASRKSVTKILGLFKKYEESENKKDEKLIKKKKIKSKTETKGKSTETEGSKKTKDTVGDESGSVKPTASEKPTEDLKSVKIRNPDDFKVSKEVKTRQSKLPVTSFRRSLNLDNVVQDSPKLAVETDVGKEKKDSDKPDKGSLKLDFSKIRGSKTEPGISENLPSTSYEYSRLDPKRNSFGTTHSSQFLSPSDDMSCDSWSICSDAHSPLSPNGQMYSGDESESVIDRIRRKSFYTRFNEKKKPHSKTYMKSYRDLDLYKDLGLRAPNNYGSLDRKSNNYDKFDRITNSSSSQTNKEYRPYNRSASVLNDYVNLVGQYQPYNPKSNYTSSLYSDSESTLDEDNSTAKSR